jgi:hypothetical protein
MVRLAAGGGFAEQLQFQAAGGGGANFGVRSYLVNDYGDVDIAWLTAS